MTIGIIPLKDGSNKDDEPSLNQEINEPTVNINSFLVEKVGDDKNLNNTILNTIEISNKAEEANKKEVLKKDSQTPK